MNNCYIVSALLCFVADQLVISCRDKTGQFEYDMAFDINMKDVTGQSALYLACYVGNQKLVDLLLKHRVQGHRVKVATPL